MTVNGCYGPFPQGGEIVQDEKLRYETLGNKERSNKDQKFVTHGCKTQFLVNVTFYTQQQGKYI